MADYKPPVRDVAFVLDNLVDLDALCELDAFSHIDADTLKGALDLLDLRRVHGERALHTHAEALLAHGEGLAGRRALALDDRAFEDLHAAALALDDLEVHAHGVARTELRDVVADLHPLQALDNGHAGVSS
jgi:hypothetical protein